MPAAALPQVDLRTVRPHRGSAATGFEELTVQIFRAEYGRAREVQRVEGAGGDAGVEAFIATGPRTEIGLQAKFFDRLTSTQWKQIERSIVRAASAHPRLRDYIVAAPLDRTPAQLQTWRALSTKWKKRVRLIWWGNSELSDFLTRAAHRGRLLYWFDAAEDFTLDWLQQQNALARAALDDRYTPTQHVQTDSQLVVEAFARRPSYQRRYIPVATRLVNAWSKMRSFGRARGEGTKDRKLTDAKRTLDTAWRTLRGVIGDGNSVPAIALLDAGCNAVLERADAVRDRLVQLDDVWQKKKKGSSDSSPYGWRLRELRELTEACWDLGSFVRKFRSADTKLLLIEGEGGIGKSHLLAALVEEIESAGNWAFLTLGEFLRSSDELWQQMLRRAGWERGTTQFLELLNHAAEATGQPAIICVDALNETPDRQLWRTQLLSFAQRVSQLQYVKLIVSCRSDFLPLCVPDLIRQNRAPEWARITHLGFGDQLFEAVSRFFTGYRITTDYFPPLLAEFRNPLFLKTVCEAYEGRRLPAGALTLRAVMDRRIARLQDKLLQDIDCPPSTTHQSVQLIASEMAEADSSTLPAQQLRPKIEALLPARGESQSLYRHLVSNRLLAEVVAPDASTILVRFQYERFADFFVAENMLSKFRSAEEVRLAWGASGFSDQLADWRYASQHAGLVRALGILLAEMFAIELPDVAPGGEANLQLLERWLSGLPWRSKPSVSARTLEILQDAEQHLGLDAVFDSLLATSTIPDHPLNANYLHQLLFGQSIVNRDQVWTTYINDRAGWPEHESSLIDVITWSEAVPMDLVSDDQALLVAILLGWYCASTRHEFRDRACLAAIRLLDQRTTVASRLVRVFDECNDPYVRVRVYAVAAGVAMRLRNTDGLADLASEVCATAFGGAAVIASISLRDFAQCILEVAAARDELPAGVKAAQLRRPMRSRFPKIWSEKRAVTIEKTKGWERIRHSIQPESTGWYGDFGRYEMGFRVRRFQNVRLGKTPKSGHSVPTFDEMAARRYVVQRIWELGWRPELFGAYESGLRHLDRSRARVERISKKYQWIALDELLAYLADHYHLAPDWSADVEPFEGAWQVHARDFDPSQPLASTVPTRVEEEPATPWWTNYPDTLRKLTSKKSRAKWVTGDNLADFESLLTVRRTGEPKEWLNLCGYHWWEEELPLGVTVADRGRLMMWIHVRSWFVKRKACDAAVHQLQGLNFWGDGISVPEFHNGWLGEYPWGRALHEFTSTYDQHERWKGVRELKLLPTVCSYGADGAARSGLLPSPRTLELLGAHWGGRNFEYVSPDGELLAFSPEPFRGHNLTACLVDARALAAVLKRRRLGLIWTVLAERSCWDGATHVTGAEGQFSGVYVFHGRQIAGGISNKFVQRIPTPSTKRAVAPRKQSTRAGGASSLDKATRQSAPGNLELRYSIGELLKQLQTNRTRKKPRSK